MLGKTSSCSPRVLPISLHHNETWQNIEFFLGQGEGAESRQNFGEAKDYYIRSATMMLEFAEEIKGQYEIEFFLKSKANEILDKIEQIKLQYEMMKQTQNQFLAPFSSALPGKEINNNNKLHQHEEIKVPLLPNIFHPNDNDNRSNSGINNNRISLSSGVQQPDQEKFDRIPISIRPTNDHNNYYDSNNNNNNEKEKKMMMMMKDNNNNNLVNNKDKNDLMNITTKPPNRKLSDADYIESLRNNMKKESTSPRTTRESTTPNSRRRRSTSNYNSRKKSYNNTSTSDYKSPYSQNKHNSKNSTSDKSSNPLEDTIREQMMEKTPSISWNDVAGLEDVKQILKESVVLPNLRPDLFTGLRSPSRGCLMFGPPGTGKTLLAKVVAAESKYSFFSISASSLMSKWIGEGEKMVKALFAVARQEQPSVIFIDEIDSMLSARRDGEHEASRRMKTEFLVQLDGASVDLEQDKILIMAATNTPWGLDEAVLRRMTKKVYIPLPDKNTRKHLIYQLLAKGNVKIDQNLVVDYIVQNTEQYSCSDINLLCKEAAMGPLRDYKGEITTINIEEIRGINLQDFQNAMKKVRPTVGVETLNRFQTWFQQSGYDEG